MKLELKINGTSHSVDVEGDTPLLWVLRDHLGMHGTKFGCGRALCGACTIHVNDEAVRACAFPVKYADGASIRTIEGLDSVPAGRAVMSAWNELDVVQCGWCQPGQCMSATALVAQNSKPSDEDIDASMSGNLCRCGTYPRIRAAIHAAARTLENGEGR